MAQPFVGQVIAVGFNFAPQGWFLCDGQLVQISQFETLFTLIGTTFGGDGTSTFGIPNLNGRVPLGMGQRADLSNYVLGESAGSESVTLLASQLGGHTHLLATSTNTGTTAVPGTTVVLGHSAFTAAPPYLPGGGLSVTLASVAIGVAGSNLPHENRQPFQTVNYIMAAFGIFPSQS